MLTIGQTTVARVGLGTNRLTNTPENVAFLREAVAAGLGMIDTAHLYTRGASEETIAAALGAGAEGVVVATKGGYESGRPEVIARDIEESLRRLRRETIDLYYLHKVHPETEIEESLGPIKERVDRGDIRHVGVSNVSVEQIERAREVVPIAAVQNHFNLAERSHDDVVDHCEANGIVFVPYFPLRDHGGRPVAEIARRHGATPAQVALAWLLRRSPVTLPIPGTLDLEHLRENLSAQELEIGDEDLAALR